MRKAIVINKITRESLSDYVKVIREYSEDLKAYSLFGSEYRLGLRPGSLEHLGIRHISKLSPKLFSIVGSVNDADELVKLLTFKVPEPVSASSVPELTELEESSDASEETEVVEEKVNLSSPVTCSETLSVALDKSYKRGSTLWAVFVAEGCCSESGVVVECSSLEYSESFEPGDELKVTLDREAAEGKTHLFVFKCAGHSVELEVEL